jgi:MFS family permease
MRLDGLWRNPDFVKLWAAETVSTFGSLISRTALPFTAILVLDAGPAEIAVLGVADIGPAIVAGLFAGVWVDRLPRRPIMIAADLGRAALLLSIPLAYALDGLRIEQLYVVAFLTGILTMFFDVAYVSYLPSLVRKEELLEGNSKLAASASVAEVGAFSASGWLVQLLSGPAAVLIDAATFLVSAVFVGSIRKPEPPPAPAALRESMAREAAAGARTIVSHPVLRTLAGTGIMEAFFLRMYGTVVLLFMTRELGFGTGVLGLIFAVGGISSLVGALVAGRAIQRLGMGIALPLGLALMGVSMLFVPLAQGATVLAATLLIAQQVVGDGAFTVYDIGQISVRQTITPERLMGRVTAGMRLSTMGAVLAGALMGGLLGETVGLRGTLVIAASGVLLAALWLAVSPVRGLRAATAGAEAEPLAPLVPEVP